MHNQTNLSTRKFLHPDYYFGILTTTSPCFLQGLICWYYKCLYCNSTPWVDQPLTLSQLHSTLPIIFSVYFLIFFPESTGLLSACVAFACWQILKDFAFPFPSLNVIEYVSVRVDHPHVDLFLFCFCYDTIPYMVLLVQLYLVLVCIFHGVVTTRESNPFPIGTVVHALHSMLVTHVSAATSSFVRLLLQTKAKGKRVVCSQSDCRPLS